MRIEGRHGPSPLLSRQPGPLEALSIEATAEELSDLIDVIQQAVDGGEASASLVSFDTGVSAFTVRRNDTPIE